MAESNADDLFCLKSPQGRQFVASFRRQWECIHGPTDLSITYTSQAPVAVQDWLIVHQPQLYFDGLPPFVQAMYAELASQAVASGMLDSLPDVIVKLFVGNGGKLIQRRGRLPRRPEGGSAAA